jgi:putative NIF3 family GTP cyclohydrolase 1 type 2
MSGRRNCKFWVIAAYFPLHLKKRMLMSSNTHKRYIDPNRRRFIRQSAAAAGAALLTASPLLNQASGLFTPNTPITVGQIIDLFISQVPGGAIPTTVDTLKSGSREMIVTGVVTTMFATIAVIKKAIALGANFIIAHEPTFYNHADATQWLESSDVYQYKANLLKEHNIAVWRNHDYIHTMRPDGVRKAITEQLGWQKFQAADNVFELNSAPTLTQLIAHAKQRLDIQMVRYIGNPAQICKKALLLVGAPGGQRQIEAIIRYQPDVLLCGELSEWETAEYVRDARAMGKPLALVVLGHIASEEPGSAYMLQWLKTNVPQVKATHITPGNSLSFM